MRECVSECYALCEGVTVFCWECQNVCVSIFLFLHVLLMCATGPPPFPHWQVEFWECLAGKTPSPRDLYALAPRLETLVQACEHSFRALLAVNPNAVPVLRRYAAFLSEVCSCVDSKGGLCDTMCHRGVSILFRLVLMCVEQRVGCVWMCMNVWVYVRVCVCLLGDSPGVPWR